MINIKKHLITFVILIAISITGILGKYIYKYKHIYKEQKHEAIFNNHLKEAAKIPDTYWDEKYQNIIIKPKYKVALIATNGGEYSYLEYFKYSAEKMGWEVNIYHYYLLGHEKEFLDFDPDFVILSPYTYSNLDMRITSHRSKKYAISFLSLQSLRNLYGWIAKKDIYQPESVFHDFILKSHGVLTAAHEVDVYRIMFERKGKTFNGLRMFPTTPKFENEPPEPNNLMWLGMGWDKFRSSNNYLNFIKLLSNNIPFKLYGSALTFYEFKNVYDGYIPPGIENIKAIRKNGIYLLTHSEWHFQGGEPSMRIFEATAANVVIISDKHPFAIEHFGDNFLYFDQNADSETMYKQVKAHYDWIKANPEKAKAMAARAHQIFLDKFTLENDLVRIAKMHEYVIKQEKEMNLSYPLAY